MGIIFKILILIMLPVLAWLFWPEIMAGAPPSLADELVAPGLAIIYGMVVALMFRSWSAKAMARKLAETKTSLKYQMEFAEEAENREAAALQKVKELEAQIAHSGPAMNPAEMIRLVEGFDPAVAEKIPALQSVIGKMQGIRWPDLDADTMMAALKAMEVIDKSLPLLDKLASLPMDDLSAQLNGVNRLVGKLEDLGLGPDGKDRDFNELRQLSNEVLDVVHTHVMPLIKGFEVFDEGRLKEAGAKIGRVTLILNQIHNVQQDDDGYGRDFDELADTAEKAGEVLQAVDKALNIEGLDIELAARRMKAAGQLVSATEAVVLDEDGDAKDFRETLDGIDGLKEFGEKVGPAMESFRRAS